MISADPLLVLLQLTDSALPIGSYSHSWGLETAVQSGQIHTADQVMAYLEGILMASIAPLEGRACGLAHGYGIAQDGHRFWQLHQRLSATRWAPEPRQASLALGCRLDQLSAQVWGLHCPGNSWEGACGRSQGSSGPHHCLAFGWIAAQAGLGAQATVQAYLFTAITALVSAAVRLVPLGHTQGQQILAQLHPQIRAAVPECLGSESLASFAPLQERDCQAHQHLYSRLFQS